jgi:hypothetical protein
LHCFDSWVGQTNGSEGQNGRRSFMAASKNVLRPQMICILCE